MVHGRPYVTAGLLPLCRSPPEDWRETIVQFVEPFLNSLKKNISARRMRDSLMVSMAAVDLRSCSSRASDGVLYLQTERSRT